MEKVKLTGIHKNNMRVSEYPGNFRPWPWVFPF